MPANYNLFPHSVTMTKPLGVFSIRAILHSFLRSGPVWRYLEFVPPQVDQVEPRKWAEPFEFCRSGRQTTLCYS